MKPWKPLPQMPFTSTIPEILDAIEGRWPEGRLANSDARADVLALIARVRELEAERDAYARSHLILKAIHGALTDALPNTPIPALDSFDVVEMVRNIVAERDQALADYQDLGRVMHEECSRLEAECERLKTFAAQNFSAMICQEVEQMREYGLSYEGVRKVLHEYNDGEISFGKLMDLIRAAARAMAEDNQRAASNLLAIIHGDGGHYEVKHGTVKACKDAEGVVSDLRVELDAATYSLETRK